jgi:hypothetical protein
VIHFGSCHRRRENRIDPPRNQRRRDVSALPRQKLEQNRLRDNEFGNELVLGQGLGVVQRRRPRAKTERKREFQGRGLTAASTALPPRSEDFEGASRAQQTDSESVDELLEEGNLFEAGAVAGVQEADAADEREVHTRELPEDEVPEEYLDKD